MYSKKEYPRCYDLHIIYYGGYLFFKSVHEPPGTNCWLDSFWQNCNEILGFHWIAAIAESQERRRMRIVMVVFLMPHNRYLSICRMLFFLCLQNLEILKEQCKKGHSFSRTQRHFKSIKTLQYVYYVVV